MSPNVRGCGGPVNPVKDLRKKDQPPEPLSPARSVFVRHTTNLGVTHAQGGLSTRPLWVTTCPLPQLAYRCFSTIRARSRTRPTCSRPQSLARQGFRNSVLNGRSPELRRAELKQRTLCQVRPARQFRGRATTLIVPGLLSPSSNGRESCPGTYWRSGRTRQRTLSDADKISPILLSPLDEEPYRARSSRIGSALF
jgi:hypothetical protein